MNIILCPCLCKSESIQLSTKDLEDEVQSFVMKTFLSLWLNQGLRELLGILFIVRINFFIDSNTIIIVALTGKFAIRFD